MKNKIAVFAGSFDPFTFGHQDIVIRCLDLFDEIFIAIGENSQKKNLFTIKERTMAIAKNFEKIPKIKVVSYEGFTVDFCKKANANFIIRGLRNTTDFEYEKSIAQMNEKISGINTFFLMAKPAFSFINANIIRDFIKNGKSVKKFVAPAILENLNLQ